LQLAQVSEHLATSLAKNPLFTQVINGRQVNLQLLTDSQVRQQNILFRYRYLLDPAVTSQYFTVDHLHRMLEKALAQLNSNLGFITQPLLGVDPGGSWQRLLAQQVSHTKGPILIHGVWFSQASDTALLLAQTRSSGFAINAQKQALTAIHQALQSDTTASKVTLMISGPGVFAVSAQQVTQQETLWLSTIASLLLNSIVISRVSSTAARRAGGLALSQWRDRGYCGGSALVS
jgi:predicted exporter